MADQSEILKAMEAQAQAMERLTNQNSELKTRVLDLEQKGAHRPHTGGDSGGGGGVAEIVATIMKDPQFLELQKGRAKSCIIPIERKTLISTPALGTSQALVAAQRLPEIVRANERRLYVRDLLPQAPTTAPAIEYTEELAFSNQAAPQGGTVMSPETTGEGEIKAESGLSFIQRTARIITVAHWIPASVQILDDAPMLENYIGNRLVYGLRLKEEDMLLNSTGTNGELNGLINQATAFNRGATPDTKLDVLRKAITQLQLADAIASGIVVNPADLESIELSKDSTGQYIVATLNVSGQPVAWRVPVVASNSIAAGKWLAGDFNTAAQIWDRQLATVEISRDHADFFVRNLCAIRAELRETLTVYRPASLVTGTY